ncbi:MAG: hypothetical protein ACREMB_27000 [Candidatus Rokuibacteriota bacterium]
MFGQSLYGMIIESSVPLPHVPPSHGREPDVSFTLEAPVARLPEVATAPWLYALDHDRARFFGLYLLDGGYLLRWHRMFDFRLSGDGSRICCTPLRGVPEATVHVYLLGRVLSLVLHLKGRPNLHGSAVATPSGAVAFLGPSGRGKSTLAVACSRHGRFLTDDVLAIGERRGQFYGMPGAPFTRLAPRVLQLLAATVPGAVVEYPVDSDDGKVRAHLAALNASPCMDSRPLKVLYVLAPGPPGAPLAVKPLRRAEAVAELLRNTYNVRYLNAELLQRHFAFLARLVQQVPVRELTYPRDLRLLPHVCAQVLDIPATVGRPAGSVPK